MTNVWHSLAHITTFVHINNNNITKMLGISIYARISLRWAHEKKPPFLGGSTSTPPFKTLSFRFWFRKSLIWYFGT